MSKIKLQKCTITLKLNKYFFTKFTRIVTTYGRLGMSSFDTLSHIHACKLHSDGRVAQGGCHVCSL